MRNFLIGSAFPLSNVHDSKNIYLKLLTLLRIYYFLRKYFQTFTEILLPLQ